ncbi:hypothetical protein [Streptomyces sp. NPDC055060]
MLTVPEVLNVRLGVLKTATNDWEAMVRKLRFLATGEGETSAHTLNKRTRNAEWKGDNATVNREFVLKTASEFNDAVTAAESVHAILRDAYSALKKQKQALQNVIDEVSKSNIYINDKGQATSSVPPTAISGGVKVHAPTDEELSAAEQRITEILWEAHETDRIAARALRALAKNEHDFSEKPVRSLKDADIQQGKKDAEYWTKKIAREDPSEWSDAELKRFNAVVKDQRDNSGFTVGFATELGADGTLKFWRDLSAPPGGEIGGDRAKMLAETQDSLSMSLANATRIDTPEMDTWKKEMLAAGPKTFPAADGLATGPYGYQVMSSLMRRGKFDSDFLDRYGTKVLEFERDHVGGPDYAWKDAARLNYPPSGTANDPVAGFLDALGHNPEASLDFFRNGSSGGKDGLETVSNWDYLVAQGDDAREWPTAENGKSIDYKSLGHALESATLGYAYDDKDPKVPLLGGEGMSEAEARKAVEAREGRLGLMSQVIENYQTADAVDEHSGIRGSLANMAAGHIDSLNYSMDNFGGAGAANGRDALFGMKDNHLSDFGLEGSANFLKAVATDQDSYSTVSSAQQVYGASLMAAQGDDRGNAVDAGVHSVKMHGLLDEVRAESIGSDFAEEKEKRNLELEKQGEWRKFATGAVVGTGVGVATELIIPTRAAAAIAVPLAFEAAGGAAETFMGNQTMDWLKENEFDNSNEAIAEIQASGSEGQRNAMLPLLNYANSGDMTAAEVRKMAERAENSYGLGGDIIDTDNSRGY